MCGINFYYTNVDEDVMVNNHILNKHRGPDNSQYKIFDLDNDYKVFLGFHRLSINDLSEKGNQPLNLRNHSNLYLICNGEIYNFRVLEKKYGFKLNSGSDCEIIIHLYNMKKEKCINELDGVFSFIIYDSENNEILVGHDPIGVRSLYMGTNDNDKSIGFSSEMKGLVNIFDNITNFKPGSYLKYSLGRDTYDIKEYYNLNYHSSVVLNKSNYDKTFILQNIKCKLMNAVKKRLISDRPIGCLLSGGLDSSLIAGILNHYFKNENRKLTTFSIGNENSPDLLQSRKVAEYLNTDHHEIIINEQDMIDNIEHTIYHTETYDITTIRASVPMFLLSKYIKENTDIKVIFSGEGSDEASGSYLYFKNAPNEKEFHNETLRLIKDLRYFDVLRCDKTTAGNGLEVRVPFLDKEFMEYYMSIDPYYKIPKNNNGIEKWLLRESFRETHLIPNDILWRQKEGFSDGVLKEKQSWRDMLAFLHNHYTDEDLENAKKKYKNHNTPLFKEALYFREIFNKLFNNQDKIIPYYWLPKWCGNYIDPSARILPVYD